MRWISVSLSLQPPQSLVNKFMDKVTMTEGIEALQGLSKMDCYPQGWIAAYCPNRQLQNHTEHSIWHHSLEGSADHLVACWFSWTSSIMEGVIPFLIGIDNFCGYEFVFPACSASVKKTQYVNILLISMLFHTALLSTKDSFCDKLNVPMTHAHGIHHVSCHF